MWTFIVVLGVVGVNPTFPISTHDEAFRTSLLLSPIVCPWRPVVKHPFGALHAPSRQKGERTKWSTGQTDTRVTAHLPLTPLPPGAKMVPSSTVGEVHEEPGESEVLITNNTLSAIASHHVGGPAFLPGGIVRHPLCWHHTTSESKTNHA